MPVLETRQESRRGLIGEKQRRSGPHEYVLCQYRVEYGIFGSIFIRSTEVTLHTLLVIWTWIGRCFIVTVRHARLNCFW